MKLLLLLALFLSTLSVTRAQIGMGTTSPNTHAVLDLRSPANNQGLLVPSMTTSQRTASTFAGSLGTTENGLLVFDTDDKRFYYWNGTAWDPIVHGTAGSGTLTSIATGAGLTGGPITSTGTISLASTTVAAGLYGNGTQIGQFTVDAQGRITAAASVTITGAPPNGTAGGDLTGAYPNPTIGTGKVTSAAVLDGAIVNADISPAAAILDSKLATITTAGKVSGSAITSGTISGTTAVNTSGSIITTTGVTASNATTANTITSTNTATGGTAISASTTSTNGGYGVFGQGTGMVVGRTQSYSYGVYGKNVYSGSFGYIGGQFGIYGDNANGTAVQGNGTTGVSGNAGATGYGVGVIGAASGVGSYGVYSNGSAGGTTTWASTSDRRYKKNIAPLQGGLEKIMALSGVSFDWRCDEYPLKNFIKTHDIGLIAQEVKTVVPEVVQQDVNGYYSVSYEKIVPVLIEAIKQQQMKIEVLEKQTNDIAMIKQKIASLEALLASASPSTIPVFTTAPNNEK